jgi:LPXTG-site transpeptidase (sortase) family protein
LRSQSLAVFLRWTQRGLVTITIAALGSAAFLILQGYFYQAYATYSLREALMNKPASVGGFLEQWLDGEFHTASKLSMSDVDKHGSEARNGIDQSRRYLPKKRRMGSASLPAGSPIGLLEIPRLKLSVIVLEGSDEHTLRLGVGHIPNTALPGEAGNTGLAAHRDTFFRPLKTIRKSDVIQITTLDGTFEYHVQSIQIVDPSSTSVLKASSSPSLTLVTCYPFYYVGSAPKRFIVHCTRTGSAETHIVQSS